MRKPITIRCPKCGVLLHQSGEADVMGVGTIPVYQCDTCTVEVDIFGDGKKQKIALTFCLDEKGQPFDPASPDGALPL